MTIEKKLDADGNPIEDESQDQQKIEELVEEIATLSKDKESLTGEITDIRKSRSEIKDELTALKDKPAPTDPPKGGDDVASIVKQVLNEEKASEAKDNKLSAFEKFITNNKEFSKENDPTGLKRDALESKMNTFNLEGIVKETAFYQVIKDSASLLGISDTDPETPKSEDVNPYTSTPVVPGSPTTTDSSDLTNLEKELIEEKGWTEEKYLKLKEKNPVYFEQLLG